MNTKKEPASKNKSNLVRTMEDQIRLEDNSTGKITITITKYPEPILNPFDEKFKGKYSSIRNPGGILYENEILLLLTVRHTKDKKSRIHIARSTDGLNFSLDEKPFIDLDQDSQLGVEDCRVIKIKGEYYLTFTAFKGIEKGKNTTRIGLIKTKNFKDIISRTILLDEWGNNKNCVIISNPNPKEFYVIHRPFFGKEKAKAYIEITKDFKKFHYLGIFLEPKTGWESARVGINSPVVDGFMLYHGADEKTNKYCMGAIMVDKQDQRNILWRSNTPLIKPELWWETTGGKEGKGAEVPNVVFGCNLISFKGKLITYYAGADRYTGRADIEIKIEKNNQHQKTHKPLL